MEESALDLKPKNADEKPPRTRGTPVTVSTKRVKNERATNQVRQSEGPIAAKLKQSA